MPEATPLEPLPTTYERDDRSERLIDIMEQLQLIVEAASDDNLDVTGVDPVYAATAEGKVSAAQLASFDAGHLYGAITIIRSCINPDYPGLAAHHERDCMRRLTRAMDAMDKRPE